MIDINKKIMEAMKAHDKVASETYKLLKAKILEFKTAKNAKEYNDAAEVQLIKKMIQEREDSANIYIQNNRQELANAEYAQRDVLNTLLPALPSNDEIKSYIDNTYPNGIEKKTMGIAIKDIKNAFNGLADGKVIADYVKTKLI